MTPLPFVTSSGAGLILLLTAACGGNGGSGDSGPRAADPTPSATTEETACEVEVDQEILNVAAWTHDSGPGGRQYFQELIAKHGAKRASTTVTAGSRYAVVEINSGAGSEPALTTLHRESAAICAQP
jgi:hypothetical protein